MGEVTLAALLGPSGFYKLQVIKRLRSEIADNAEFLEMFLHEARLAARLSHPNIVHTNEVGFDQGSYFIAMEYLEGQTLHALFRKMRRKDGFGDSLLTAGPLSEPTPLSGRMSVVPPMSTRNPPSSGRLFPVSVGLRVIADILEGLHYAHEMTDDGGHPMSLVHRDVSPGNVFICYDGTVKLLDFGIAKAADSQLYTQAGILKGKVPYMAPEQFRSRNVDRRCDVYAVGAILWELAAGVRLWHGLSDIEIVTQLSTGGAPSPRTVNPDVDPRLESICMHALALDADDRYRTARELQIDVEALLRELGGVSGRSVGRLVSNLFAQKRAQQQSVVESKLREFRQSQGLSATGDFGVRSTRRSQPSFEEVPYSRPPPSLAPAHTMPPQTARTTGGLTAPSFPVVVPPRRPSRLWLLLPAAAVFMLIVVSTFVVARKTGSSRSRPTGPVASAPDKPSGMPDKAPVRRSRVVIDASPADAALYLDDARLNTNPWAADLPLDGLSHRVRAEANGFQSESRLVLFSNENTHVSFTLKRRH